MMIVELLANDHKDNIAPMVSLNCNTNSTMSNLSYNKGLESHFGPIGMEFQNSTHVANLLDKIFEHVDRRHAAASVTNVGDHQISNFTNYNITLTILDLEVATGLLKNLQGNISI